MVVHAVDRVLAQAVPRLEEDLAVGVAARVLHEPPVEVHAVARPRRDRRLVGEEHGPHGPGPLRPGPGRQERQAGEHEVVVGDREALGGEPEVLQLVPGVDGHDVGPAAVEVAGRDALQDQADPAGHDHRPGAQAALLQADGQPTDLRAEQRAHDHVGGRRRLEDVVPVRGAHRGEADVVELPLGEARPAAGRQHLDDRAAALQLVADAGRPLQLGVEGGDDHDPRGP